MLLAAQDDIETGGTFNPRAYNARSQASGLAQFIPSTWARFGRGSPFNARDAIMAQAN